MRVLLGSVAFALAAAGLGAAAGPSPTPVRRGEAPSLAQLSRYSTFKDATFAHAKSALVIPPTWDFRPTVSTGEAVSIHLSRQYYATSDAAAAQRWADLFAGLVHGSELSSLAAYVLTPTEVESVCGRDALACYGANQLFAPAADPSARLSAAAVATHEYGHHVAAHRRNDPWDALDYGTKRWASYEEVCAKARRGQLFPGSEDRDRYQLNPGEGFAETFRVLNERRQGLVESPWQIVTTSLYPDDQALAAVDQDVTSPWTRNTSSVLTGFVGARERVRSFVVPTPLDGGIRLVLRHARRARLSLDLLSPSSRRLAHAQGKKALVEAATICGQRAVRVRISRLSGSSSFRLTVSKP